MLLAVQGPIMTRYFWAAFALVFVLVILIERLRRWTRKSRRRQSPRRKGKLISLVLLLKLPRELDRATLSAAAKRAFPNQNVEVKSIKGHLAVKLDDLFLGVINFAGTYVDDPGRAAEGARDFAVKMALQDHTAWLSVDSMGMTPKGGVERVFRAIGRLIAELAGDDVLALYSPYTGQGIGWDADVLPLLRSKDPLAVFAVKRKDKIVSADGDDAQVQAAVVEARRRWPEFVEAFNHRRKGQAFSIKVPFAAEDKDEFMWVEVLRIQGSQVQGRLANEPRNLPNLKMGDPVTVSVDDLNDWLYIDGRNRFGGFTAAVLRGRQ